MASLIHLLLLLSERKNCKNEPKKERKNKCRAVHSARKKAMSTVNCIGALHPLGIDCPQLI